MARSLAVAVDLTVADEADEAAVADGLLDFLHLAATSFDVGPAIFSFDDAEAAGMPPAQLEARLVAVVDFVKDLAECSRALGGLVDDLLREPEGDEPDLGAGEIVDVLEDADWVDRFVDTRATLAGLLERAVELELAEEVPA